MSGRAGGWLTRSAQESPKAEAILADCQLSATAHATRTFLTTSWALDSTPAPVFSLAPEGATQIIASLPENSLQRSNLRRLLLRLYFSLALPLLCVFVWERASEWGRRWMYLHTRRPLDSWSAPHIFAFAAPFFHRRTHTGRNELAKAEICGVFCNLLTCAVLFIL